MIPAKRPPTPEILIEHGTDWTEEYLKRRERDKNARWRWPTAKGEPLNQILCRAFEPMTSKHCAYCDHEQLGAGSEETIDHFRPKTSHPQLAYDWNNLFPACNKCQSCKRDTFDEALLRPDAPDYRFERYFVFNFNSGEIAPCPGSSVEDQQRAATTIRILGLNLPLRNKARKRAQRRYYSNEAWLRFQHEMIDLPYRFLAPPQEA